MTIEKVETIDTLVIGAGQAGVAASEHLSQLGVAHVVLERDRIAERWRTGRWDSLVSDPDLANGEGSDPTESPDTFCTDPETGEELECTETATGTVSTWYLYDTPATNSARQEIAGSHPTHPTVAASGTCTAASTGGRPWRSARSASSGRPSSSSTEGSSRKGFDWAMR